MKQSAQIQTADRAVRIPAVDLARTTALAGMIVFHAARDLEFLGAIPRGTTLANGWPLFASLIAGGFLFLSGCSLYLGHPAGIQWRRYFRRLAILVLAAAAVTGATYAAMPQMFVYFGILHSIAVASVMGLAFLRAPVWLTFGAAALVYFLPEIYRSIWFDTPILYWTGLSTSVRPTLDFEPVFPWFAPFLAGLAFAKAMDQLGLWIRIPNATGPIWRLLAWPGRHSLLIYLLHQPILIGIIWAALRLRS